jgi:hypothetical protein
MIPRNRTLDIDSKGAITNQLTFRKYTKDRYLNKFDQKNFEKFNTRKNKKEK